VRTGCPRLAERDWSPERESEGEKEDKRDSRLQIVVLKREGKRLPKGSCLRDESEERLQKLLALPRTSVRGGVWPKRLGEVKERTMERGGHYEMSGGVGGGGVRVGNRRGKHRSAEKGKKD